MLEIGSKAPDFKLYSAKEELISLSMFLGKKIVLYFYPKDNTSGCTKQAMNFKNVYDELKKLNVVLIGISKDSILSHQKFIANYELPFILLSDTNLIAIKAYDVWKEKKLYGKTYMGIIRSTFIIDENGYIIQASEHVNPATNPTQVLTFLQTL